MLKLDEHSLQSEMTAWRRRFHADPEFGFEERKTAAFVAAKLREFGLDDVAEGVGGTGVVGTLRRGSGNRSIALRADMDALRITEQGAHGHRSQNDGLMHACGHDGHTAALLGAAKTLATEGGFDGTVRFVFQPAEEWGRGALAMLDDGLLHRFPFEEIYGLHNDPTLEVGSFTTRPGAFRSAEDNFEIVLAGLGGHAARPQSTKEVLVAACATVMNLQTIVSRRVSPADIVVVSVTELVTDGTRNALPGQARILGDVRSFRPDVSAQVEKEMGVVAQGTAAAYGVRASVTYTREFVPLLNDALLTQETISAIEGEFGKQSFSLAEASRTGSEDFARFLDFVPGCFVNFGNGLESAPLHNPKYDFNDSALLSAARLHAAIVRRRLKAN